MTSDSKSSSLAGVALAFGAFLAWGFAPVYFKSVGVAGAFEIACHRVVWSVVLLLPVALLARTPRQIKESVGGPRRWGVYLVTSLLISSNWLLYIWAVNAGHIVESSLGYYINPLVNVLLGMAFLGERLRRVQGAAIGLALLGVATLVVHLGQLPWLSLVLPLQFGLYGLIRKRVGLDPLVGLLLETALLAPAALAFLGWRAATGQLVFAAHGWAFALLLVFAGVMTSVPLLLFLHGAARLSLTTLGVLQYVSPTCQLALGVLLYGEPFTAAHGVTFACIWAGLAVFSADAYRRRERRVATGAPAPATPASPAPAPTRPGG
jgi:chloramphenicol-sensitive protein RarD